MNTLLKLTWRELIYHRTRFLLALLAIVATCCMIVWFIGSFDIVRNAAKSDIQNYFGDYHIVIAKKGGGNLPEALLEDLRADTKNVVRADRAFQTSCNAARAVSETAGLDKLRATMGVPQRNPVLMGMEMTVSPFQVEDGRWFTPDSASLQGEDGECLISISAGQMLQRPLMVKQGEEQKLEEPVQLGEMVDVNTSAGNFHLKVVGVLKQGISTTGLSTQGGGGRQPPPPQNQQNQDGGRRQGQDASSGQPAVQIPGATVTEASATTAVGTPAAELSSGPAKTDAAKTAPEETSAMNATTASGNLPAGLAAPPAPVPLGGGPGGQGVISLTEPAVYIPLEMARKIAGVPDGFNLIYIQIQGMSVAEFRQQWEKKCNLADISVTFYDVDGLQEMIDARNSTDSIMKQAYGAIGLVVLAALLIIFTTLSMGVNERTRQLAILRTLGFTKGQIAGLITLEGAMLGLFGWAGGLLAGWLMLQVIVSMNAGLGISSVALSNLTILVALLTSLVGALLASILPAWRATRVAPLDALSQNRTQPPQKGIYLSAFCGAALLFLVWLFVFIVPLEIKIAGKDVSMSVNIFPAIGFLLIAPLVVVVIEKLFAPVVARLFGMNPAFLANQLSSNKWRTLGTTLSLCIGLGVYCMIQIWGYSMLGPFLPSKNLPDTLVAFLPSGIPYTEVQSVMDIPGVVQEDFMPLAIEQPRISQEILDRAKDDNMLRQMNNVVLFGVDPQIAFRADNPTVKLKYLDGDRQSVLRALCDYEQRACVIPDSLALRFNLKVGDKLPLVLPASAKGQTPGGFGGRRAMAGARGGQRDDSGSGTVNNNEGNMSSEEGAAVVTPALERRTPSDGVNPPRGGLGGPGGKGRGGRPGGPAGGDSDIVEYKIVAIVEIPGWHWITKTTGVRTQSGRTAGMVFASYENVKSDFNLPRNGFFWMNTEEGTTHAFIEQEMQKIATRAGAVSTDDNLHLARAAMGVTQGFVKVSTHETLMASIGRRSQSMIQGFARMPMIILLITTLAVMNTMIASVRTRRWEMGILRAYGVTRSGLVRLVLAEALLIGLCACVLSFAFGIFAAACMVKGAATFGAGFLGGVIPPMVIPWGYLSLGFAIALGVCIFAAIVPAMRAGREEPAALLVKKE